LLAVAVKPGKKKMTQRYGFPPSERIPDEQPLCPIRGPAIQRARERLGFDVNSWDQMNWYIQFSRVDFHAISDGDLLNIQEEVVALCRLLDNYVSQSLLTRRALKALQQELTKHLEGLVDKGAVRLGPFTYETMIYRLKDIIKKSGSSQVAEFPDPPEWITLRTITSDGTSKSYTPTRLLSHFGELLSEFKQSIIRCPRCQRIFLKNRRHAQYCDRYCQSRSAAQANRERKKDKKRKKQSATTKGRQSITKRRK
jgi:hypothetical protein